MNKETILTALQNIFRSIFNDEKLNINLKTTQAEIEQWDSLNHAMIIDQVEKQFKIKFDLMDMLSMQTVEEICEKVIAKKEGQA